MDHFSINYVFNHFSFYRNVCAHCKCPRELHDIYHRDFVNVEERLGIKIENSNANMPGKGSKTSTTTANSIPPMSKETKLNIGYSWFPPGLSKKQVRAYKAYVKIQVRPAWWQRCLRRCGGVYAPAAHSALCHWGFDSCALIR